MASQLFDRSVLSDPREIAEYCECIPQASAGYSIIGTAPDGAIQLWNTGVHGESEAIEDAVRAVTTRWDAHGKHIGFSSISEDISEQVRFSESHRVAEQKHRSLNCDPGLMKQVFTNLLSNAVKYTRPRKPAAIAWAST
jgi:signal transduction histidine kinase